MESATVSNARLRLGGHAPGSAVLDVTPRPARTRAIRALTTLLGFLVLAPIVFFIPPHLPWVIAAAGGGIYLALRQWRGEYIVNDFRGACPRCESILSIDSGTRIRLPHTLVCYDCHHQPSLSLYE